MLTRKHAGSAEGVSMGARVSPPHTTVETGTGLGSGLGLGSGSGSGLGLELVLGLQSGFISLHLSSLFSTSLLLSLPYHLLSPPLFTSLHLSSPPFTSLHLTPSLRSLPSFMSSQYSHHHRRLSAPYIPLSRSLPPMSPW